MTTIELLDQIKNKIENAEKETIVKALGYNNKKIGLKRLSALISTKNIEEWLKKNGYDFCYSNESFLIKLCDILGFEETYYIKIIKKTTDRLKAINRMPTPYIYVNTSFRREDPQSLLLSYMKGGRIIPIDRVKVFDSCDDGLSMAKRIIKKHYKKTQGIPMWCKIDNYSYNVNDKKYIINTVGEIENASKEIFESRAVISIGNRPITFLDREINK